MRMKQKWTRRAMIEREAHNLWWGSRHGNLNAADYASRGQWFRIWLLSMQVEILRDRSVSSQKKGILGSRECLGFPLLVSFYIFRWGCFFSASDITGVLFQRDIKRKKKEKRSSSTFESNPSLWLVGGSTSFLLWFCVSKRLWTAL